MKLVLKFLPIAACILTSGMAAAQDRPNCTCRHQGLDYQLGEEICIARTSGSVLARCEMVLNNTSWNFSDAPCPKTSQNNLNGESESDFDRFAASDSQGAYQISQSAAPD